MFAKWVTVSRKRPGLWRVQTWLPVVEDRGTAGLSSL
jgi:hypothetical protein